VWQRRDPHYREIDYVVEAGADPKRLEALLKEHADKLVKGHVTFVICFLNGAATNIKDEEWGQRAEYVAEPPDLEEDFSKLCTALLRFPRPVMWLGGSALSWGYHNISGWKALVRKCYMIAMSKGLHCFTGEELCESFTMHTDGVHFAETPANEGKWVDMIDQVARIQMALYPGDAYERQYREEFKGANGLEAQLVGVGDGSVPVAAAVEETSVARRVVASVPASSAAASSASSVVEPPAQWIGAAPAVAEASGANRVTEASGGDAGAACDDGR